MTFLGNRINEENPRKMPIFLEKIGGVVYYVICVFMFIFKDRKVYFLTLTVKGRTNALL